MYLFLIAIIGAFYTYSISAFTGNFWPIFKVHGKSASKRCNLQPFYALNEEERDYISPMRDRPKPKGGDVAYNNENIIRQNIHFTNIRKVGGSDCVMDIYTRDPSTSGSATRFWFVGKVARCTGKFTIAGSGRPNV